MHSSGFGQRLPSGVLKDVGRGELAEGDAPGESRQAPAGEKPAEIRGGKEELPVSLVHRRAKSMDWPARTGLAMDRRGPGGHLVPETAETARLLRMAVGSDQPAPAERTSRPVQGPRRLPQPADRHRVQPLTEPGAGFPVEEHHSGRESIPGGIRQFA